MATKGRIHRTDVVLKLEDVKFTTSGANAEVILNPAAPTTGNEIGIAWFGATYTGAGTGNLELFQQINAVISGQQLQMKDGTGAGGADQLVRTTGSFVTDGLAAGDLIVTTGFVNGANNTTWVVGAILALTVDLLNRAGASVAVNETLAAGGTATEYTTRMDEPFSTTVTPGHDHANAPLMCGKDKRILAILDAGGGGIYGRIEMHLPEFTP